MMGIESIIQKPVEKPDFSAVIDETPEHKEFSKNIEGNNKPVVEPPMFLSLSEHLDSLSWNSVL